VAACDVSLVDFSKVHSSGNMCMTSVCPSVTLLVDCDHIVQQKWEIGK